MKSKLKGALLVLTAFAAVALPAIPAHATTCDASDPTVKFVVCDVVYSNTFPILCHVKIGCL